LKVKKSENVSEEIEILVEVALQSCQLGVYDLSEVELNISSDYLVKNLSQYQYLPYEMIPISCFDGIEEDAGSAFNRILTFQGFCASFNLLNSDEIFTDKMHKDFYHTLDNPELQWDLSNGYANTSNDYPHRMSNGKYKTFDAILLQDQGNVDKDCSSFRRGYEVYWHLPNEMLTQWHSSVNINNINKDNQIYLRTKSFKMSSELQKYNVKYRQCYFDGEKKLKYFKIYTEKNCKFECLSNFTLSKHGCVRYYMPRDSLTQICTTKVLDDEISSEIEFEDASDTNHCDCYPPCNNIQYELYSWAEINLLPDMNYGENFDFSPKVTYEFKRKDFDR
jgi:amiloride-sensitive sodium channel